MEGKHRLQGTDVPERQVGPGRPRPDVCKAAPAFSFLLLHLRGEIPQQTNTLRATHASSSGSGPGNCLVKLPFQIIRGLPWSDVSGSDRPNASFKIDCSSVVRMLSTSLSVPWEWTHPRKFS